MNPSNISYEESHNTLKYANRAKCIPVNANANIERFEHKLTIQLNEERESAGIKTARTRSMAAPPVLSGPKRSESSPPVESKRRRASLSVGSIRLYNSSCTKEAPVVGTSSMDTSSIADIKLSSRISSEEKEKIRKTMQQFKEETDALAKENENLKKKMKKEITERDMELLALRQEVAVLRRHSIGGLPAISTSMSSFPPPDCPTSTTPRTSLTPKRSHSDLDFETYSPPLKKNNFTPILEEREEALERILTPAVASRLLVPAPELSEYFDDGSIRGKLCI